MTANDRKFILIAGLPGSGKSTASAYLNRCGLKTLSMGSFVLDSIKRKKLELSETNEEKTREFMRESYGDDVFARLAVEKIRKKAYTGNRIVIEGIRNVAELSFLKKQLKNTYLIYIDADETIRHQRLQNRRKRRMNLRDIHKREQYEKVTLGIRDVKHLSDCLLLNEGTKSEFFASIDNLIIQINI